MANSFQGFPKEMFTFLEQLANNNNREWFNANKARYKSEVVAPVMDFIDAIRPGLSDISPYYVADSRPHVPCFVSTRTHDSPKTNDPTRNMLDASFVIPRVKMLTPPAFMFICLLMKSSSVPVSGVHPIRYSTRSVPPSWRNRRSGQR